MLELFREGFELFFAEFGKTLKLLDKVDKFDVLLTADGELVVGDNGTGDDGDDCNREEGKNHAKYFASGCDGDGFAETNGANKLKAIPHGFSKGVKGRIDAINEVGNNPVECKEC